MKPAGPGLLLVGSLFLFLLFVFLFLFNYRLYFTFSDLSVQIISFFLIHFGALYVSRKLSISSRLSNLLAYNCS